MAQTTIFNLTEKERQQFEKLMKLIKEGKNILVVGHARTRKSALVRYIVERMKSDILLSSYFDDYRGVANNIIQFSLESDTIESEIVCFMDAEHFDPNGVRNMLRFIKPTNPQVVITWDTAHLPSAPNELFDLEMVSFD